MKMKERVRRMQGVVGSLEASFKFFQISSPREGFH